MKRKSMTAMTIVAMGLAICLARLTWAAPVGMTYTYQGRLIESDKAGDGLYDLAFRLFDDPCTGTQQGVTVNIDDLDVIDGYFTVELDFGEVFDGYARWMEIDVRPSASIDGNDFVTLIPRQEVTPTPYALYAQSAEDANTVDGLHANEFSLKLHSHNASSITSGTLSTSRYSAFSDLSTEGYLGNLAGDIAQNNGILQSKLNADVLDGFDSSDFLTSVNDYGRSGVSSNLYEGTMALSSKYLGISDIAANSDMLDGLHESSFFNLAQGEIVTGRPSFNGGISGATPPFYVDSTNVVTNLNADRLDGLHSSSFAASGHIHNYDATYVNVTGDSMTGPLDAIYNSTLDYAVKGEGQNGPTNGYLGVQGNDSYDSIISTYWSGWEIGIAGISTGSTTTDNIGVLGHASHAGVRGEYSGDPNNYGELGRRGGYGIYASGSNYAGYFTGGKSYFGGDVGIGTTVPSEKLEVDGTVKITKASGNYLDLKHDGTNGEISTNTGNLNLNPGQSVVIGTATSSTDLVLNDGLALIMSSGLASPDYAGTDGELYVELDLEADGNVYFSKVYNSIASARDVYISSTGQLGYLSSSKRYKEDIAPLNDDCNKILEAQPVTFTYKESKERGIGFIAEDLNELGLENLVFYDEQGRPDGIQYEQVSLYLLEILKDQAKSIEELKTENETLKQQLIEENQMLKDRLGVLEDTFKRSKLIDLKQTGKSTY